MSTVRKERLQYPLIRKNGDLQRASWDEAMFIIVKKTKDLQKRLINHGISFYASGQLFLERYYVLARIGKAGLNTLHMDGNTRLCTAVLQLPCGSHSASTVNLGHILTLTLLIVCPLSGTIPR